MNDPTTPAATPQDRGWRGDLLLAASFLTRLPLPLCPTMAAGALARAMRTFPLVGAALGLAAGLAAMLLNAVLPPLPAALLTVLVLVLATGALHEDGLADFSDGLGARGDRDRRLEVMRDSRNGTFGVVALILSIGLRASALAEIPEGWAQVGALVAAASLSRGLIPAVMQILAPARPDGLGAAAGCPDASVAAAAAGLGLLASIFGLGFGGALTALVLAGLVGWAMAGVARRAFGGYTGDVLGAVQQGGEIAILLAAAMVWA
ncbi:Cobalamin synthase [Candidatus Terasakiella magnetica]|nr:Cobalamin synthase [Candidatus Terasakiella magnetica]